MQLQNYLFLLTGKTSSGLGVRMALGAISRVDGYEMYPEPAEACLGSLISQSFSLCLASLR